MERITFTEWVERCDLLEENRVEITPEEVAAAKADPSRMGDLMKKVHTIASMQLYRRGLTDSNEREDLAQDVVMQAMKKFDTIENLGGWAVNAANLMYGKWARRKSDHATVLGTKDSEEDPFIKQLNRGRSNPRDIAIGNEEKEIFSKAIGMLDGVYQDVLRGVMSGKSAQEIGDEIGRNAANVNVIKGRAMKKVKEIMRAFYDGVVEQVEARIELVVETMLYG